MVKATCNGCTRILLVRPPSLEMIVKTLAMLPKQERGGITGMMLAAVTPLIPMIPPDAMDKLPTVMQIYCPVCTIEIIERAEREESNGTEHRNAAGDGA